jgi:hypothetical protein
VQGSGEERRSLDDAEAIALLTVALDCHVDWVTWLSALPDLERHQRTGETLAWHAMWVAIYRDVIALIKAPHLPAREGDGAQVDLRTLAARYLGADRADQRSGVDARRPCLYEREEAR